jgi:hypothetical protein
MKKLNFVFKSIIKRSRKKIICKLYEEETIFISAFNGENLNEGFLYFINEEFLYFINEGFLYFINEGFLYFIDEGFLYFINEGFLYFINEGFLYFVLIINSFISYC